MRPTQIAWFLAVMSAIGAAGCMETRRALGDDCLKDDDCLSGICSQLRCAAPAPTIDAAIVADATTTPDAAAQPDAGAQEAGLGEAGPPDGSAPEAPAEAASDAAEAASSEGAAGGDAAGD